MNKFLEEHNLIQKHNNISDFIRNNKKEQFQCFNTRNKCYRIAVDTMLYAHKFKYSYNDIIYGFTLQIINFLSNRILPIYIIDGIAPVEKSSLIKSRNNKKQKINTKIEKLENNFKEETCPKEKDLIKKKIVQLRKNNIKISKEDIDNIIELINLFGLNCIRADSEADSLIGNLYINNYIDACLSEDMDILIFGCKKMIKFYNKKIYEYDLDYILFRLNISYDQFLEMCILFGCDYLKPLPNLECDTIYNYIYNNKLIDLIQLAKLNCYDKYLNNFKNTKNLFLNSSHKISGKKLSFSLKKPIDLEILKKINKKTNKVLENKKLNIKYDLSYINTLIRDHKFN